MKKLLLFVMAIMATTTTFAQAVDDVFTDGTISYKVTSVTPMECEVTGSTDTASVEDLTVPMTATDASGPYVYTVTRIGANAYDNKAPNLVNVTLPATVTSLGFRSFHKVYNLETINLANVVSFDTKDVFARDSKIIAADLSSATYIGEYTFYNNQALEDLNLPVIETIKGNAFQLSGISSITLGSSLSAIDGTNHFAECSNLGAVKLDWTVPGDIVSIVSADVFPSLSGITIYVEAGMTASYNGTGWDDFTIVEGEIPLNIGVTFTEGDFDYIITGADTASLTGTNNDILDFVTIPTTASYGGDDYMVTAIGASAFIGNTAILTVDIPSAINAIGSKAFEGCSNLYSVTLPSSITELAGSVFKSCASLTSLDTQYITSISGQDTFNGSGITSLDLSNLTHLGRNGLGRMFYLTGTIDLPKVEYIDEYAFVFVGEQDKLGGGTGVTTINLGKYLNSVEVLTFFGVDDLTNLNISAETPPAVGGEAAGLAFDFQDTPASSVQLAVPSAAAKTAYEGALGWQSFGNDPALGANIVVDLTLSTNDVDASEFSMYPNPTDGLVSIRNSKNEDMNVSVYDLNGRSLLKTNDSQVDISDLASGIYLFKVKTVSAEIVKRVVKN